MGYPMLPKFTAKEQRYVDYMANESNSRNIGDICRALHTTPRTLLGKTAPEVDRKIATYEKDYKKWCWEIGINPDLGD